MNAHMQINSPVLRRQAQQSVARRERLWPQQVVQISHHDGHVIAFREYIAKHGTPDEKRKAVMARRAALIRKWGRYRKQSILVATEADDALPAGPQVSFIISQISARMGVSVNDILSQRRTSECVQARHVAIYLAKVMTTRSLPEIGRRFAGRDHTTILHATRKIQFLVNNDPDFAKEIEAHRRAIVEAAHAGA